MGGRVLCKICVNHCGCSKRRLAWSLFGLAAGIRDTLANVLTCAIRRQVCITVAPRPGPTYPLRNAFALQMAPDTLIATIWYQVAQAVTGHNDFRRCEGLGCDVWIEISLGPSGSKPSKRYCSDACRMSPFEPASATHAHAGKRASHSEKLLSP